VYPGAAFGAVALEHNAGHVTLLVLWVGWFFRLESVMTTPSCWFLFVGFSGWC